VSRLLFCCHLVLRLLSCRYLDQAFEACTLLRHVGILMMDELRLVEVLLEQSQLLLVRPTLGTLRHQLRALRLLACGQLLHTSAALSQSQQPQRSRLDSCPFFWQSSAAHIYQGLEKCRNERRQLKGDRCACV